MKSRSACSSDRRVVRRDRKRFCRTRTPARWATCRAESMDRRFFHSLGASLLDRTICSTAADEGMRMTVGANIGADGEGIPESDLVLLWGTNTLTSNPHLWPFVLQARERGARVIAHRSDAHAHRRAVRRVARASVRGPTRRSRWR